MASFSTVAMASFSSVADTWFGTETGQCNGKIKATVEPFACLNDIGSGQAK